MASKPIIHTLHLSHRTDREKSMLEQAENQGFDIMWFEGERCMNRKDTKKAICTSHKKIIQYAKDNGMDEILIAEDDCRWFGPGSFQYFLDHKPEVYHLYCALIYAGDVKDRRIVNGMSGTMTCFYAHSSIYDVILNDVADDSHIDRSLGDLSHKYLFYVPPKMCAYQYGGYSDNQKKHINNYDGYLENRLVYGRD